MRQIDSVDFLVPSWLGESAPKGIEKTAQKMAVDDTMEEDNASPVNSNRPLTESFIDLQKSLENDFQAVQVQWQDIVLAASRAKKSTGGGLCQLTPWHLKSAVLNSPGNKCGKMLALWANRWARGDFDTELGAILTCQD